MLLRPGCGPRARRPPIIRGMHALHEYACARVGSAPRYFPSTNPPTTAVSNSLSLASVMPRNPARSGAAFVHDLNAAPALPFAADAEYDAVLCCCGVQYLEQPEQVFAEARRGPDAALARALSFLPTARS